MESRIAHPREDISLPILVCELIDRLRAVVDIAKPLVKGHPTAIGAFDDQMAQVWIEARSLMTMGKDALVWMGDGNLFAAQRRSTLQACRGELQTALKILPEGTQYRIAVQGYLEEFTEVPAHL